MYNDQDALTGYAQDLSLKRKDYEPDTEKHARLTEAIDALEDRITELQNGEKVPGLLRSDVEAQIQQLAEGIKDHTPGGVHVRQSFDELPEYLQEKARARLGDAADGQVEAVYYKGKIWLVANNLHSADLSKLVFKHEAGHLITDIAHDTLDVQRFFNNLWLAKKEQIEGFAKSQGRDTSTQEGRNEAVEEWWVESVAQGHYNEGGLKGWWNKYVTAFKDGLRKRLGFDLKLSDSEIADMARRYREMMMGQGKVGLENGENRLYTADTIPQFRIKGGANDNDERSENGGIGRRKTPELQLQREAISRLESKYRPNGADTSEPSGPYGREKHWR